MEPSTIKFSPQSLEFPAINIYVHLISILLIAYLLKLTFGNQIKILSLILINKIKDFLYKETIDDWLANCKERSEWPNKQDVLGLDLKGQYLKSLTFSVSLTGKTDYWRAGFVIGNEKLKANEIIDTANAITIHTGSAYKKEDKILPVWKYYDNFNHNNPDTSNVKSEPPGLRTFQVDINSNNFMQVRVQNELIFAQRINPAFRRRVYLKAWADDKQNIQVKFKNISYSLKNE